MSDFVLILRLYIFRRYNQFFVKCVLCALYWPRCKSPSVSIGFCSTFVWFLLGLVIPEALNSLHLGPTYILFNRPYWGRRKGMTPFFSLRQQDFCEQKKIGFSTSGLPVNGFSAIVVSVPKNQIDLFSWLWWCDIARQLGWMTLHCNQLFHFCHCKKSRRYINT